MKDLTTMHKPLKLGVVWDPDSESQDPPKTPVAAELGSEVCADRPDSPYPRMYGVT